jgi:hypothetical protein
MMNQKPILFADYTSILVTHVSFTHFTTNKTDLNIGYENKLICNITLTKFFGYNSWLYIDLY